MDRIKDRYPKENKHIQYEYNTLSFDYGYSLDSKWSRKETYANLNFCTSEEIQKERIKSFVYRIDDVLNIISKFGWRVISVVSINEIHSNVKIMYTFEREKKK